MQIARYLLTHLLIPADLFLNRGKLPSTVVRQGRTQSEHQRFVRCLCRKHRSAQTSASWLSGGRSQRLLMPQAATSVGQPRPVSRLVRAGRPYRP